MLRRRSGVRVAADPAPVAGAETPGGAGAGACWSYWRWHGAPRMYYSAYGAPALRALARSLASTGTARKPAWCILDNTAHGHAMADAARLVTFLPAGSSWGQA